MSLHSKEFIAAFRQETALLLCQRGADAQANTWGKTNTPDETQQPLKNAVKMALARQTLSPDLDLAKQIAKKPEPLFGTKENNPYGNIKIALLLCGKALNAPIGNENSGRLEHSAITKINDLCESEGGQALRAKSKYFDALYKRAQWGCWL